MKLNKIAALAIALLVVLALGACGGAASTMSSDLLEDAKGIRVTAENAGADQSIMTEGAIDVEDGDVIIISPCLDKGSFNLKIATSDGVVAYDDKAEGRVYFQIEAAPGTYDVTVSGDNATGWMTVFAAPAEDIANQNEALSEILSEQGIEETTDSGK